MTTVFLTGGTGFVGGALLRRLVASGVPVRALARSASGAATVSELGGEAVSGDLLEADLQAAMEGCSVVYHVAGINELCTRNPRAMVATNVGGTRSVVEAAAAAGVARIVYTSSAVTLGEAEGTVGSESSPHRGRYLSTYERSKHEAEIVAFETAGSLGVELVSVNPSSVQGPGRVGGSAKLLLYALRSRRPWLFDTMLSIVDIDDCTTAHVRAAAHGSSGERYVVSGTTLSVREAVARMATAADTVVQPRLIPDGIVRAAGYPLSFVAQYLPLPVPVCPEMLRVLLHGHRYDGRLAARELGFTYTPIDETLARTVAWYRDSGMLGPR